MSTSRSDSRSVYSRRRSSTAQSVLRPPPAPPLIVGDTKVLKSWVHDPKDNPDVIFNYTWWPGVAEGDMVTISANVPDSQPFLFIVPPETTCAKPQLQISIPKPIAEVFSCKNYGEVVVSKVDQNSYCADYVEFKFQDQYLGRNDMWRLSKHLVGQCIYANQDISFIGSIVATIQNIYVGGKKVSTAYVTPRTKAVFRSLSAKFTIFIQVCRELWEFAGDGERYTEKIVHSFLPALFSKWREAGTNHTVTIVLISRVYYDQSEIDYAAGPLRRDERGEWYKDFYKVITDLQIIYEWKPTLVSLKNSFLDFQRDILLAHHYHRMSLSGTVPAEHVRLVGRLSYAHDGPVLEALNLGLRPNETHYIDRSLTSTGVATMLITPGTGYFRVSKSLLRLTTTRMLDHGFGLDLICLTKHPLHHSPIFSFQGSEPETRLDSVYGTRAMDPLWGGDFESKDNVPLKTFWWEPFWISVSFWDKQMDLPFRKDRFVARAKMHEIQMLGLLDYDVLSSIEVPFLGSSESESQDVSPLSQNAADQFDFDVFALNRDLRAARRPLLTSSSPIAPVSQRVERRQSHRTSLMTAKIQAIDESPRMIYHELPPDNNTATTSSTIVSVTSQTAVSKSPSSKSISSLRSNLSSSSKPSSARQEQQSPRSSTLSSKLTPAWLFKPFRSGPTEPQTSNISASASLPSGLAVDATTTVTFPTSTTSSTRLPTIKTSMSTHVPRSPLAMPMNIKASQTTRSNLARTIEEDTFGLIKGPLRRSPVGTSPRDDQAFSKRRSALNMSFSSASPGSLPNPSQSHVKVSYAQSSLAARWQHIFPHPTHKHDIKWKSLITPGCLPLTVEYFPTNSELEMSYDVTSYDFVVDPSEMRSFLVKFPPAKGNQEDRRRACALAVMQGMAAVRLAQGFQFVIRPPHEESEPEEKTAFHRTKSFMINSDTDRKPAGAADVFKSPPTCVYLSMSNEIHRISYSNEMIQVRRYVRRMPPAKPFEYQCLIWPKLGVGYTEQKTTFTSHGLENYGWNRLDMLVAGYEHEFNESLRYWRTRFVVIPTPKPPSVNFGPLGKELNEEEIRILGIEKLAEQFTKARWQHPEDKSPAPPPVRFLPTTLSPAASVLDESLIDQLDQIHAAGPLRKKAKSEREIEDMPLSAVAKAMREEDGVPIKNYTWHNSRYPDSFTGFDFVSWLVREFRDVSSRAQGTEWGVKLQEQGLIEHCRGYHSFLDGHYFYRLKGEYASVSTPRWFGRGVRHNFMDDLTLTSRSDPNSPRNKGDSSRRKTTLILSQSMIIDIDQSKRSDQAEPVYLHHDIIHNPGTIFHFELQWIGTTARYIEDQVRQWNRSIEKYGLKLVEAYVTQIADVRERNAFQSCFPVRLAVPPPPVPAAFPQDVQYFEYSLLRKFGFILDIEAADLYPDSVDVVYSYRRSPYKYSQFVHRTGVAFAQVLNEGRGFLFLTNRLLGPERSPVGIKSEHRNARPEDIRIKLHQFCSDQDELRKFYDEALKALGTVPEEPPPLAI